MSAALTSKRPFTLVKNTISHDTVEALEQLLIEARSGDIIGITFAAMHNEKTYIIDTVGAAYRNPTFARGMVAALDDELRDMVHR